MKRVSDRRGFSLVEVTLAIAIAAFCLITIIGLLPEGLSATRNSGQQTTAASLATSVVADLRAAPATSNVTPFYNINLTGTAGLLLYLNEDSSLNANPTSPNGTVYRVSITITPPAALSSAASTAWIKMTWPAATDPAKATPAGTYETVVSLNRN